MKTGNAATEQARKLRYTKAQSAYVYTGIKRTIIAGTIGSLLMMFGSFGVGWLADASPLKRLDLIIMLRYNVGWIIFCIIALAVGGMLLCREWLRLSQKLVGWGPSSKKWVWAAIICWSLPQCFAFPLFSRDVFSYFGQGRVMQAGLNPYEHGVSSINSFFQYGADPLWAQSPPPYGPLFLWIEEFVVWLSQGSVDVGVYLFRFVAVVGVWLIAFYAPKLARLHGVNPNRTLWLIVANPLLIAQFITAAHNDALMTGLMVAGAFYARFYRSWKGGLLGTTLVTLAIAIKPIALPALAFIGLLWAGKNASWPRKFFYWGLVGLISMSQLAFMGFLNGLGFGWIGALSTTGGQSIWYAPVGLLAMVLAGIVGWLTGGAPNTDIQNIIGSIGKLTGMILAVITMFVGKYESIVQRIGISLGFIVLLAPMIQSWYLLWFIPFLVVAGIKNDWQLDLYFITTVFFMVYAVCDQLDVSPYLDDFDINMGRLIAVVVSLGYATYLVFIDPATRRVLRRRRRPIAYELVV